MPVLFEKTERDDPDWPYIEQAGYPEYVEAHTSSMEGLVACRDEANVLVHIDEHLHLLHGFMHVGHWLLLRHTGIFAEASQSPAGLRTVEAEVEGESAAFFLLDAARDAALRLFVDARSKGEEPDYDESARKGVSILGHALAADGDPVGIRATVSNKSEKYRTQLVRRVAKLVHAQNALLHKPSATDASRELMKHGYTVEGPIAAGAFSTILRACCTATGEEVAVKTFDGARCAKKSLHAESRDRELAVLRQLREKAKGGDGRHPHLVNMIDEHEGPASIHLILEIATGGSLLRYLQVLQKNPSKGTKTKVARGGIGMPQALVQRLGSQIVSALAYLHGLGIAHRDVKPANILLSGNASDGSTPAAIKLCDFGFAVACGDRVLKKYVGTPAYSAPELLAGNNSGYQGPPVDMWAFGAVLYEMLHGRCAFSAGNGSQLDLRIRNVSHEPFDGSLPAGAKQLIGKLLVGAPAKRAVARDVVSKGWLKPGLPVENATGASSSAPSPSSSSASTSSAAKEEAEPEAEATFDAKSLLDKARGLFIGA